MTRIVLPGLLILAAIIASCILSADAKFAFWGGSTSRFASPTIFSLKTPQLVDTSFLSSGETIASLSCGRQHCLLRTSSGRIFHWGSYVSSVSPSGLFGTANNTGENLFFSSPTFLNFSSVLPPGRTIMKMAAGGANDYFFDDAGSLYIRLHFRLALSVATEWTEARFGPVAEVKTIMSSSPFVGSGDKLRSTAIVVSTNGTIYSLGALDGLVVNGGVADPNTECNPLQTLDAINYEYCVVDLSNCPGGSFKQLATGQDFALVLQDGGLCGWGSNKVGVLGDIGLVGTIVGRPITVNVNNVIGGGGGPPPMPPPASVPPPGVGAPKSGPMPPMGGQPPPQGPPPMSPPPQSGSPTVGPPPPQGPPPQTGSPTVGPPPPQGPPPASGAPTKPPPPPGTPPPPGSAPTKPPPPPGMPPPGMPPPGTPPPGAKRSVKQARSTLAYIEGSNMFSIYAGSNFVYLEYQPLGDSIFTSTVYIGWGGVPDGSLNPAYELGLSTSSSTPSYWSAASPKLVSLLTPSSTKLLTLAGRNVFSCIYNDPGDAAAHNCYTFGLGGSGELGSGESSPSATLVPLSGVFFGKTIDSIESMRSTWADDELYSSSAAFAVANGGTALISWGDNREGKLGTGTTSSITDISIVGGAIRLAAATRDTFAFVSRTGVLYTVGANNPPGILGNGDTATAGTSVPEVVLPQQVENGQLSVTTIESITAGEGFFAALAKTDFSTTTSALVIWWGLVPLGTVQSLSRPQEVIFNNTRNTRFRLLSCGRAHCLGVQSQAGQVHAWGLNTNGQISVGGPSAYAPLQARRLGAPMFGIANVTQIVQVAASDTFSAVLVNSGRVYWWGTLSWSADRNPTQFCSRSSSYCTPRYLESDPAPLPGIDSISGRVVSLLASWYGAYFTNHTHTNNVFEDVNFAPSGYLLMRTNSQQLWGWGANSFGTLGQTVPLLGPAQAGANMNWDANIIYNAPVAIFPQYNFSSRIAAGASHVAAVTSEGDFLVWGTGATSGAFASVSTAAISPTVPIVITANTTNNPLSSADGLYRPRQVIGVWGRYITFAQSRPFVTGGENENFFASTGSLVITGNEFGTDPSAIGVKVILQTASSNITEDCTVISVQETKLTCTLSGNSTLYRPGPVGAVIEVGEQRTSTVQVAILRENFSLATPGTIPRATLRTPAVNLVVPGSNLPDRFTADDLPTFSASVNFPNVSASCAFTSISTNNVYCTLTFSQVSVDLAESVDSAEVIISMNYNGFSSTPIVVASIVRLPKIQPSSDRLARTGARLVIRGSGFESSTAASQISFDPPVLFEVLASNETAISLKLLGSSRTGVTNVTVTAYGGTSGSATAVSLVDPVQLIVPNPPRKFSTTKGWLEVDGYGWNAFETDKIPQMELIITSASKRAVLATVPCMTSFTTSGSVNCSFPTLPASGSLSLNVTLWGATNTFGFGTIVPSALIDQSAPIKLAEVGNYVISLSGSNFADLNNDPVSALFDPPIACTPVSSTATSFVCDPVGTVPRGNLSVTLYTNGGPSNTVVIAEIVPRPTITTSSGEISGLTTAVTISGQNFHDIPSLNNVTLDANVNASFSIELRCNVDVAQSSSTQIVCTGLDFSNIPTPALIQASVSAYSSEFTPLTTIATLPKPEAPNAAGVASGAIQRDQLIGIIVGVVIGVIIVIIAAFFISRWRVRKVREQQVMKMQEQFREKLEEMNKEAKDIFNIKASDIVIQSKLGEGSYGAVYLGLWRKKYVAVKKLLISSGAQASEFFREASLMLSLKDHPNVVKVYGMCQEQQNFSLILEFLPGGSLDGFVESQTYGPDLIWQFAYGIASGMASLAEQGIVHRDLATRNVLLDSNLTPKVADFGYARVVGAGESGQTNANVGPVRWMAPECIGHKKYSEATDVWAYASTLYEILAKHEPFAGVDLMDVAVNVRDNGANPGIPEDTPLWLRGIMQSCWQVDPAERPTFKTICELLLTVKPISVSLPSAPYTAGGDARVTNGGYDEFGPSAGKVEGGKKKKSKSKAPVYDDINIEMEQV